MIAWQNLIWIILLSMVIGAMVLVCIACVVVGKESEEKTKVFNQSKEQENDNQNA